VPSLPVPRHTARPLRTMIRSPRLLDRPSDLSSPPSAVSGLR